MSKANVAGRRMSCALAVVAGAAMAMPASAETIRVPQDRPTIQAAIDAAVMGDVVLVSPGTYTGEGNRNIDTKSKAITVRSAGGAATCIINAGASPERGEYHSVFITQGTETSATVIEGFTVTGGNMFNGGGIMVVGGSPTIRDCVITGNECICWGAGVYVQSSGNPRFINCRVVGNTSAAEGGGFFMVGSGVARIENCLIEGNSAQTGGGICTFSGQPVFVNCKITGNHAGWGGAAYMWGGKIVNCTMAGNTAEFYGAAVYGGASSTQIINSIAWGNVGPTQLDGSFMTSYSIVEGGAPGVGNRASDPRFTAPALGDYSLRPGSPAIDAGLNPAVPAGVTTDKSGAPRFVNDLMTADTGLGSGAIVDIGAFEFGRKRFATPAQ